MKKLNLPAGISSLSIGKRILGSFLDGLFCLALMGLLYIVLGRPVVLNNNGYNEMTSTRAEFIEGPGILDKSERGEYTFKNFADYDEASGEYGYQKYEELTWNYFTVFLPNHDEYLFTPEKFVKTQGQKLSSFDESKRHDAAYVGQWTFENFFQSDYYVAAKTGDTPDYTKRPVLSDMAKEEENGKLKYHRALRAYFYSYESEKGAYVEAGHNLVRQPRLTEIDASISQKQWAATIPSIVIAPLVFYYLIPSLLPNGRTLGKLIVGAAVLDERGFTASRSQILIRSVLPTALWFLLIMPWIYVAVLAFLFAIALLYMFVVMSPSGQGLYDRLAHTVVINGRTSIWFRSQEEMDEYIETHPKSSLAKSRQNGSKAPSYAPTKEEYGVLDSSMIGQARKTAETIESFDEFESREEKKEPAPTLKPREESKEDPVIEQSQEQTTLEKEEENFTDDPK